jgi:hypothetical protein
MCVYGMCMSFVCMYACEDGMHACYVCATIDLAHRSNTLFKCMNKTTRLSLHILTHASVSSGHEQVTASQRRESRVLVRQWREIDDH